MCTVLSPVNNTMHASYLHFNITQSVRQQHTAECHPVLEATCCSTSCPCSLAMQHVPAGSGCKSCTPCPPCKGPSPSSAGACWPSLPPHLAQCLGSATGPPRWGQQIYLSVCSKAAALVIHMSARSGYFCSLQHACIPQSSRTAAMHACCHDAARQGFSG